MFMMDTVIGAPPQNTFLQAALCATCQYKLEKPGRFERTVGEITVIATSYKEHAYYVQRGTQNPVKCCYVGKKSQKW